MAAREYHVTFHIEVTDGRAKPDEVIEALTDGGELDIEIDTAEGAVLLLTAVSATAGKLVR